MSTSLTGLVIGLLLNNWITWLLIAIPFGLLAAVIIMNRMAERAAFARIDGRPGAAGAALSLVGLGLAGRLHPGSVLLSVVLLPVLLLGQVLGVRLRGHLAPGVTRYAVLALCAASALTLLVRSLA